MKTKLSRIALLLATVLILPFVQGCYGDKVNVAAAWVPELQGIVVVAGGNGTAAGGGSGTSGAPAIPGGGGGNYIP